MHVSEKLKKAKERLELILSLDIEKEIKKEILDFLENEIRKLEKQQHFSEEKYIPSLKYMRRGCLNMELITETAERVEKRG